MRVALLLLVIFSIKSYAMGSGSSLYVDLVNDVDNVPLSNVKVLAFQRRSDNSLKWVQERTSDANGWMEFNLQGLGSGTAYVLQTRQQYGNVWIRSGDINHPGDYRFNIRNVRVKAVNGRDNLILSGHNIDAYKRNASGKYTWFASAKTNADGLADFYLPNLSSGQRYVFKSLSSVDSNIWYSSKVISQTGKFTFTVGNKPLTVSLVNALGQRPTAKLEVEVYHRLPDKSLKWFQKKTSDSNGQVNFDLQGLGHGTAYVLKSQLPYGGGWVSSGDIQDAGNYTFNISNVRLKVINGLNNLALNGHKVHVYKRDLNNKDTWFSEAKTSEEGLADFFLPNLTAGQRYVFKSQSPADSEIWYSSDEIVQNGKSTFVIGNKSLAVSLINALDKNPIPNIKVVAYQRLSDNSLRWAQEKTSDQNGRVNFDLQGLGAGKKYVLISRPYGVEISSNDISETGGYSIQAGAVRATLRQKTDGSLLAGKKLHLFERVASGKLEWRASSVTSQKGVVHFDNEGLGHGKVFVIYGKNLLDNNLDYYSQWISSKGQLQFNVDLGGLHELDETLPSFDSFLPQNNSVLSATGFLLTIKATDNDAVKQVAIRIVDPVKGVTSGQAVLSKGEWTFSVAEKMISKGQKITVEAEAVDFAGNKAKVTYRYSIANDQEGPDVSITSHRNGDPVDEKGFLLRGTVTDNTKYVKMSAKIIDPANGGIIYDKELEVGKNHHWALLAKDLPKGWDITVELKAVDSAGNETNSQIVLKVPADKPGMAQLINRITFGATPELIMELREQGADAFIQSQLHPEWINDDRVEQILDKVHANEPGPGDTLQNTQIVRAIYSKRQLLEVMTLFWESHFNTDLGKVDNARLEQLENSLFREHALGNFADLLNISASSPAMLIYLDNRYNYGDDPNENYARELLELHTLGVDNGYSSEDIAEVARAFTGWGVHYGKFKFHKWIHDEMDKTVLGNYIPAYSGINDGEQVLDLLAGNDATAQHICTKLLKFFVSDDSSAKAVDHCAEDFKQYKDEENQIALVLEGIFTSASFSHSLNFHSKVKTPFEFFAGLARQLSVSVNYYTTRESLDGMEMRLFNAHTPAGWPEAGKDWVNSNQLNQRWLVARDTVFNTPSKWHNHIAEPARFFIDQGIETAEGVLGYLFQILLSHDYSKQEWNAVLSILTNSSTEKFDIYLPDADERIRRTMALILQYPEYQLQ